MRELLEKYKITGKIFQYFRIPRSKAEEYIKSLEKEGYSIDDISSAFCTVEINNLKYIPSHWRNLIRYYLKNK